MGSSKKFIRLNNLNLLQKFTVVSVSLILSFFNSYGLKVNYPDGLGTMSGSYNDIGLFAKFVLLSILFATLSLGFISYQDSFVQEKNKLVSWLDHKMIFFKTKKKSFLFILVLWGIFLLPFFPVVSGWDLVAQIHEMVDVKSSVAAANIFNVYPIGQYLTDGTNTVWTNQHGAFLTAFYGLTIKYSWLIFDSYLPAYLFLGLSHFLFAVFSYSYTLSVIHNVAKSTYLKAIGTVFIIFNPVIFLSTISLSKNPLFLSAFVLFMGLLIQILLQNKRMDIRWMTMTFFAVFLGSIAVKWASILFFLVGVFLVFSLKKAGLKKISISVLLPVAVIKIMLLILSSNGVILNGDPIEGKGLQIQQVGRYLKYYPNDLSESQYKTLNKLFKVENMGKLYQTYNVDPLKSSGYPDKFSKASTQLGYRFQTVKKKDWEDFNKVWLELYKKHPEVMNDGFVAQVGNYLEPSRIPMDDVATTIPSDSIGHGYGSLQYSKWTHKLYHNIIRNGLGIIYDRVFNSHFAFFMHGNFWIVVLLLMAPAYFSNWKKFTLIVPVLLQIPIAMLSPLSNSTRYTLGLIAVTPMLLMLINTKMQKDEKNHFKASR
ncbi:DUF6020 family protein [Fructobacillus sp. M1-13]|uniref:Glycosyltransferase RgtA/B/C/D-like domain-containing protein n=1 Tax=Fructobacillus papyriferae TaxID=2713171 RepID=A0ABS5QSF4_9LACO|nr:DUF6020 family protein [Fructobacillus papyriferae]MBS9334887.1 hypothetical protein [Fructobacillus papyriferae]MCD2158877.1 DUF6020 family protein [Fructobacillus papyriferae]